MCGRGGRHTRTRITHVLLKLQGGEGCRRSADGHMNGEAVLMRAAGALMTPTVLPRRNGVAPFATVNRLHVGSQEVAIL